MVKEFSLLEPFLFRVCRFREKNVTFQWYFLAIIWIRSFLHKRSFLFLSFSLDLETFEFEHSKPLLDMGQRNSSRVDRFPRTKWRSHEISEPRFIYSTETIILQIEAERWLRSSITFLLLLQKTKIDISRIRSTQDIQVINFPFPIQLKKYFCVSSG